MNSSPLPTTELVPSPFADDAPRAPLVVPRERLFVPWLLVSAGCAVAMLLVPEVQVVAFHLIWILFALAYGFEPWPVRRTVIALSGVTVATGGILVQKARTGDMAWEETTEIGLMLLLAVLVMAHVQRRQAALAETRRLAEQTARAAAQRERLARLTSHEMRTPLTIALGFLANVLSREDRAQVSKDLLVVQDELARLGRAGERLIRMMRLGDELARPLAALDDVTRETVARWSAVAVRHWAVEGAAIGSLVHPERFRACLDTVLENALRYTEPPDTIRVSLGRDATRSFVAIADSGPGFDDGHAAELNDPRGAPSGAVGLSGQTGLGLGLVRDLVALDAGVVRVGRSAEGGGLVLLVLPHRPSP